MVSSLIVVFTCIEMLVLPLVAAFFLHNEPMVAGGWMGLAVKSDGGAIASGAITDALIRAKAMEAGIIWESAVDHRGSTTVKIFIDIFIGVWAFVLAWVWAAKFDKTRGERTMTFGDVGASRASCWAMCYLHDHAADLPAVQGTGRPWARTSSVRSDLCVPSSSL